MKLYRSFYVRIIHWQLFDLENLNVVNHAVHNSPRHQTPQQAASLFLSTSIQSNHHKLHPVTACDPQTKLIGLYFFRQINLEIFHITKRRRDLFLISTFKKQTRTPPRLEKAKL